MTDNIPPELRSFLGRHVRSIAHLEAILFIFRHRDRAWSATEISDELRTNAAYARNQLMDLTRSGLLRRDDSSGELFQYIGSEEDDQWIERLIVFYHERKVTVINTIHASSIDKLKSLANAFKIKKDES